jgi:hypothetical protein
MEERFDDAGDDRKATPYSGTALARICKASVLARHTLIGSQQDTNRRCGGLWRR